MKNTYDFIVIGAGIAGCTFVSSLNKRFPEASILVIEHGRRLGGRSTSRQSRKNPILQFDHGLSSIAFSNFLSKELRTFISPLIKSEKLIEISKDILFINEFGNMNNVLNNQTIYRSVPLMINFSQEIINQSINHIKINYLFQTFIQSLRYKDNLWEVQINKERSIRSKNLILSSSLIAHPRCLKILNIKTLPLREAIRKGKDDLIDSLIIKLRQQDFVKRKNYILYVSKLDIIENFHYKYLQIWFEKSIIVASNFEKIIFQKQFDGTMIIILNCLFYEGFFDINSSQIIESLMSIFIKHKNFLDLFSYASLIDQMYWRSSQPINNLLPKDLQWSSKSKIGFCGDWIDHSGCGGVERAMKSSIRLAGLLN